MQTITNNCGILMTAFNDEVTTYDYIAMAKFNNLLIKHKTGNTVPVSLITDSDEEIANFDSVIKVDRPKGSNRALINSGKTISYEWFNDYRIESFSLSPYTKTLLIDSDLLNVSNLHILSLNADLDFSMAKLGSSYPPQKTEIKHFKTIESLWATVVYFNKQHDLPYKIFDMAEVIRTNYKEYCMLFGVKSMPFRNDYVFTIASHLVAPSKAHIYTISNVHVDLNLTGIRENHVVNDVDLEFDNNKIVTLYNAHIINKSYSNSQFIKDVISCNSIGEYFRNK